MVALVLVTLYLKGTCISLDKIHTIKLSKILTYALKIRIVCVCVCVFSF